MAYGASAAGMRCSDGVVKDIGGGSIGQAIDAWPRLRERLAEMDPIIIHRYSPRAWIRLENPILDDSRGKRIVAKIPGTEPHADSC